ncbi:hypothetical protein A3766_14965 [Oleiphilus sp. HI0132]|uniref:DUF4917 family protein n=1 Tax=Oleiphilus sp. HI0132 TaxID=1822270 RepID=UPI0007C3BF40|nr:DUF4917 family protein [Oleiphilus sp. HI0132]KZZ76093.1 hypothetical protein A3766_14965 [Oleiphilus sp. HI0132]
MAEKIVAWKDIEDKFNGTILLGNGASIAVDERFAYGSLKQHAIDSGLLTSDVQSIFDFFHTDDFELILRIVWQANNVNKALEIDDDKTESSYIHVRDSLISAVRHIHPEHGEVVDKIELIYGFIKKFNRIISLNYDLLIYWAVMYGSEVNDKHALKDCFVNSEFDDDWQRFQEPIGNQRQCSLVFYPHGNLVLARDKIENERKISANGDGLLESILQKWENGSYVPLFVSEGTSKQKQKSIQSSYYLNTVYREVLANLSDNLTIYGWGFGEHDMHILERISLSGIKRVAVSVYKNDQAFCSRAHQILVDHLGKDCEITFFDSESEGSWIHA